MCVETPITHDPLPAILEGETSMLPENDRARDWTNGKIEAVKAPWNEHNTHRSWQHVQQKNPRVPVSDAWNSLNVFKSYA
jgi:hypothetical protein